MLTLFRCPTAYPLGARESDQSVTFVLGVGPTVLPGPIRKGKASHGCPDVIA